MHGRFSDMLISEFSRKSGVSVHTLRYYEKLGLLKSVRRNASGRRVYEANDLEWMQWINRLKSTGMPLAGIKKFAELRLIGDASMTDRRNMLMDHATKLEAEIDRLNHELGIVRYKVQAYQEKILELE